MSAESTLSSVTLIFCNGTLPLLVTIYVHVTVSPATSRGPDTGVSASTSLVCFSISIDGVSSIL